MAKVIAFTDGGAEPNPGTGGWGVVLRYGEHKKELYGGEEYATNNAMELTAALKALQSLTKSCQIEIRSDSQYLVNTMTRGWNRNKNVELWDAIDSEASKHTVTWTWVRGHVGNVDNERAHELAERGIREQRRKSA